MSSDNQHIDQNLIIKVVAGFATEQEIQDVELRCQTDSSFNADFLAIQSVWDKTGDLLGKKIVDADKAWEKMKHEKLHQGNEQDVKTNSRAVYMFLKIAAVFAIISTLLFLYVQLLEVNDTVLYADQRITNKVLSDSTILTLAKGAELTFSEEFNITSRIVKLKGKAYFDVPHIKKKPFVIKTSNLTVSVVGTSFMVNDSPLSKELHVAVNKGTVMVNYKDAIYYVEAGQEIIIDKVREEFPTVSKLDENNLSWKTKKLIFNNNTLPYVVDKINETYNVAVELHTSNIDECRVTASFDNVALQSLLMVLESTLNVDIKQIGKKIVIEADNCE